MSLALNCNASKRDEPLWSRKSSSCLIFLIIIFWSKNIQKRILKQAKEQIREWNLVPLFPQPLNIPIMRFALPPSQTNSWTVRHNYRFRTAWPITKELRCVFFSSHKRNRYMSTRTERGKWLNSQVLYEDLRITGNPKVQVLMMPNQKGG